MDIINLTGVGNKSKEILNKLNIYTDSDLINHYPFRYNFYRLKNITDIDLEDNDLVEVKVETHPVVNFIKKKFNRMQFNVVNKNTLFKVTIFNRAFEKNLIVPGKTIYISGKYDKLKNSFVASNIKFSLPDNFIEPVYHLAKGINNTLFIKLLSQIDFNNCHEIIPEYINQRYGFIDKSEALKLIHFPKSVNDIKKAKLKLIYEELFAFMFKILYSRNINTLSYNKEKVFDKKLITSFIDKLPFNLTTDQFNALNDILKDISSDKQMNRLIIGDVGSGKTIIGVISLFANYLAGYQGAFMAPTEVLAIQHYRNISKLLKDYLNVELLIGSMTKKEKNSVIERLKNNEIDVIIGTHALIQDSVCFNNLGQVITDEQHRFGVVQRKNLQEKGNKPDCLFMSATPIPRTFALALYGDLNVSYIKEKPMGRKDIITKVVHEKNIKEVLKKIYEQVNLGYQVFVVSPLISDNLDDDIKSVYKLEENLNKAFNSMFKIEVMHGKLSNIEKQAIMNDFKENRINILISTTVIEVGVDIPNATMMVIFNSERFGLATLHQLRGRVGRNTIDSYCYLICNQDSERLKVLEESNDGFYISEKDLELRKEGDLFGTRQSGVMTFNLADLYRDGKILFQAKKDCEEFIKGERYLDNPYYNNIIKDIKCLD